MLTHQTGKETFINDKLIGRQFNLTQENIDHGERKNPHLCALGLSLKQNINNGGYVSLSQRGISIYFEKTGFADLLIQTNISKEVSDWITDFDMNRKVSPLKLVFGKHVKQDKTDRFDIDLNVV